MTPETLYDLRIDTGDLEPRLIGDLTLGEVLDLVEEWADDSTDFQIYVR